MKITRFEAREQQILAKLRSRPRLEGQHVTDTIYCNVKSWGWARLGAASGDVPQFDDATLLRFLMGHGMAGVLEEGEVSQIESIAPDSSDVGTLDVWLRDHPAEIKVTYVSMNKDVGEQDHWLQQLGEYTWRTTKRDRKQPWGELWLVHLLGDHGRKACPEHGVPIIPPGTSIKDRPRAEHPDTGSKRLICPECSEFLEDGERETTLRCHRIDWTWEELDSLHSIHVWRQTRLQDNIEDADYGIGNPPPIEWGFDFECKGCPVKERIGCPGRGESIDLADALEGSILQLEEAKT